MSALSNQLLFQFLSQIAAQQGLTATTVPPCRLSELLQKAIRLNTFKFLGTPHEYKVMPLRECMVPPELEACDTPAKVFEYWKRHIPANPYFNPECECFSILLLNTRRRLRGHQTVSIGTLDTILVHPREVFRLAVITSAAAIILTHNHPSGDPTPSEADIKVTRDLIRAGQVLKIEVLDHVIIGDVRFASLRELGYFYSP